MQWEEISLDKIKSKVKDDIAECSKKIKDFIELINIKLDDVEKLHEPKCIILRKKESVYEDDGNTESDGYGYKVFWICSLNQYQPSLSNIMNNIQEECLYFEYEESERIRDHKSIGMRYLSLYLCGIDSPRCENFVQRIDYNNNNYALTSIINVKNAATCILDIQEIRKRRKLEEFLKNINKI